jgi:23S rRNA pseudouridine2604 synthase
MALAGIVNGEVSIDGQVCFENSYIHPYQLIEFRKQVIQNPNSYSYHILNKPKGVECTLNTEVPSNLNMLLPEPNLFYAGRLDKNSTGLVLLTNDGHIYNQIIDPKKKMEKVYEVVLEKEYSEAFLEEMLMVLLFWVKLPYHVWLSPSTAIHLKLL